MRFLVAAIFGGAALTASARVNERMDEFTLPRGDVSKAIGTETVGGHFDELLESGAPVGKPKKFSARRLNQANGKPSPTRLLTIYTLDPAKGPFIFGKLPAARFLISQADTKSKFPKDVEVTVTKVKEDLLRVEAKDASNPNRKLAVTRVTADEIKSKDTLRAAAAKAESLPEIATGGKLLKQPIGVRTRGGVFRVVLPAGSSQTALKDQFHDICTSQKGQITCRLPVYAGSSFAIENCKLFETYVISGWKPADAIQYVRVTFQVDKAGQPALSAGLLESDKNGKLYRSASGEPRLTNVALHVESLASYQRRLGDGQGIHEGEHMAAEKALLTGKRAPLPGSLFSGEL